jgi:hypothetical protein
MAPFFQRRKFPMQHGARHPQFICFVIKRNPAVGVGGLLYSCEKFKIFKAVLVTMKMLVKATLLKNNLNSNHRSPYKGQQMTAAMAELNQFQRSKDRLTEILYNLMCKSTIDEETSSYMRVIEVSIQTLDHKIEEFRCQGLEAGIRDQ